MTAYNEKYTVWVNPEARSPYVNHAFFEAEAAFIPLYRQLYAMFKANPYVEDTDLEWMGFPPRSVTDPHPAEVPTTSPTITVRHPALNVLKFLFRTQDGRRAKPDDVHGIELKWGFAETLPEDSSELPHSEFSTKMSYILTFTGFEHSRQVCYAARYENTVGEKGPWSAIEAVTVS